MMKKSMNVLLSLWLVLLLSACSNAADLSALSQFVKPPKVSVEDVVLQDLSMTQGTALLRLNVSNPNPIPIPLEGIEYGLNLNGKTVAQGQQAQQITLQPNQPASVEIPIQVGFQELLGMLPGITGLGDVNYDLQGAVSLPMLKIPFSRRGNVAIKR